MVLKYVCVFGNDVLPTWLIIQMFQQ